MISGHFMEKRHIKDSYSAVHISSSRLHSEMNINMFRTKHLKQDVSSNYILFSVAQVNK